MKNDVEKAGIEETTEATMGLKLNCVENPPRQIPKDQAGQVGWVLCIVYCVLCIVFR